jgi:hypothetical protein
MHQAPSRPRPRLGIASALLLGCGVAVALGVYGRVHTPKPHPLFTAGFTSYVAFKVWFATAAAVLVLVQLVTALWMFGRLPGTGAAPAWVGPLHRWSGAVAFVLLVPVALNCLYAIGFQTSFGARSLVHSVAGCAFYGAYVAKMLGLRLRGLPGWAVPVFGGLLFLCFVAVFATSAVWYFQSGRTLT